VQLLDELAGLVLHVEAPEEADRAGLATRSVSALTRTSQCASLWEVRVAALTQGADRVGLAQRGVQSCGGCFCEGSLSRDKFLF
jgi:hypothetical protein